MGFLSILGGLAKTAAQVAAPYVLKKVAKWAVPDQAMHELAAGSRGLSQSITLKDGRTFTLTLTAESHPAIFAAFKKHSERLRAIEAGTYSNPYEAVTEVHPLVFEGLDNKGIPVSLDAELYYTSQGS